MAGTEWIASVVEVGVGRDEPKSRKKFDRRVSLVVEVSSWARTGTGGGGSGKAASVRAVLQALLPGMREGPRVACNPGKA